MAVVRMSLAVCTTSAHEFDWIDGSYSKDASHFHLAPEVSALRTTIRPVQVNIDGNATFFDQVAMNPNTRAVSLTGALFLTGMQTWHRASGWLGFLRCWLLVR
jgi:hypothetical protein